MKTKLARNFYSNKVKGKQKLSKDFDNLSDTFIRISNGGWRVSSVAKSTGCSFRGLSIHTVTTVCNSSSRDLFPSYGL